LDLTQSTKDGLRFRINIFKYDITALNVYSYVGDEASEDELLHSAGAENSRNCAKLSFQIVTRAGALYKRVYLENIKLTGCNARQLQKHKAALRKFSDNRVPLSAKKKLILQRGGFRLPVLLAIFIVRKK